MCCSTTCRASVEFVKTGKLKALGVTTAKRNATLPDLPAIGETVTGYEADLYLMRCRAEGHSGRFVVEVLNKVF